MGGEGESARNVIKNNPGIEKLKRQAELSTDPRVISALQGYSSGSMSLQEALKAASSAKLDRVSENDADRLAYINGKRDSWVQGHTVSGRNGQSESTAVNEEDIIPTQAEADKALAEEYAQSIATKNADIDRQNQDSGDLYRALVDQMATDPLTGTKMATEQVQSNPLLSSIFGKGGLNDRLATEEQELASRGWTLQPEDYEAYGQASDETARMYGQEEASLANALAARGLAASPSGVAGAAFSGIQGTKSERLASAQRKLAEDRMRTNMERLDSTRKFALMGNQLAQAAVQDQFGRNQTGVNEYQDRLKNAVHAGEIEQGQENAEFEQKQATAGPSAGELGLSLLGAGLGSLAGGAGASLGAGLGQALGGADIYKGGRTKANNDGKTG